jgi:hypothetical protein
MLAMQLRRSHTEGLEHHQLPHVEISDLPMGGGGDLAMKLSLHGLCSPEAHRRSEAPPNSHAAIVISA